MSLEALRSGKQSNINMRSRTGSRRWRDNGMLPQLKVLTDRPASIDQKQGAAALDVATA